MKGDLYQVKMNCPVCETVFNTSRVRTGRCIVEKRDADFCTYYKGENPIFYYAIVCPNCGYSAVTKGFADVSNTEKERIYETIGRKWVSKDLGGKRTIEDAMQAYKLALYCSQLKDNISYISTAAACMRLAWLNRYSENRDKEKHFITHALTLYMTGYSEEKLTAGMDEITLIYMIGELNRRLGNYGEAVIWFNRTVSHQMRFEKPAIEKLAREQWHLTREQAEEVKKGERKNSI